MVEIAPFIQQNEKVWDRFVETSINGNIFHTRKFLNYHPPGKFQDFSLMFLKKGNPVALLPAINKQGSIISHGGSSYGGFIINEKAGYDLCNEIIESGLKYLRSKNATNLQITFPPKFYWNTPHDYLEFSLLNHGARYIKRELTNACGFIGNNYFDHFINKARGAIRRSKRLGILVESTQVPDNKKLEQFYEVLEVNRNSLGAPITHSPEDLKVLFNNIPGYLELFLAKKDEKVIGSGLTFRCNQKVDLIFYVAHLKEAHGFKPIHLLVDAIYESAKSRGVQWVDYGISTLNGIALNDGDLIRFKENFNMPGYFRDTFEVNLQE